MVDECDENIDDEVKIVSESKNKCNSCILYIVLFSIFFIINVGIGAYFVYYKYMNRNEENASKYYDYVCISNKKLLIQMGEIKQINIKNRTYYFYNDIIDIKNLDARFLKIDKKSYRNIVIYNIGYIAIKN